MTKLSAVVKEEVKVDSKRQTKFKIAIRPTEQWKVQAIAEFRARRLAKNVANVSTSGSHAINSNLTSSNNRKASESAKSESRQELTQAQKSAIVEQRLKELEYWNSRSLVAKERIASLHTVKHSLLWLLKKVNLHERSLINDYPPMQQPN